jgi:hypothetical protein
MKSLTSKWVAAGRRRLAGALVVVAMVQSAGGARADQAPSGASGDDDVTALALRWFAAMRDGEVDRSQYAAAYAAQITDDAVRAMSGHLNSYGAAPTEAEIVQTRSAGKRSFYAVKFTFPQGDATTLSFGFDAAGKITGISLAGMAGD